MSSNFKYLVFGLISISIFACKTDVAPSDPIDYSKIQAQNTDGTVNIIVEIPAGTTAKYELNKKTQTLQIDSVNHQPRYINYLPYPSNYGMIPGTLLPKSQGGDGDPLDIILLGQSVERGSIQKAKVIGALKLLDTGENDDKLIAVPIASHWTQCNDILDLDSIYQGSLTILETFFKNYKGNNQMEIKGRANAIEAEKILQQSIQGFQAQQN